MLTWSRRAVLLAAVLASLAVPAHAQDPDDTNIGEDPPVELNGGKGGDGDDGGNGNGGSTGGEETGGREDGGRELADTGAEPALIAMAGLGLLLAGTGLRLRPPRTRP